MLSVQAIRKSFHSPVLNGISIAIPAGSIVGIVGPSGGGKSTLLKIISGLLDPDSGNVFWNEERVIGPSEQLIPGHPEIRLVNQDFGLDLYHTVIENITGQMQYLPADTIRTFSEELLELVELSGVRDQQAIHLSGGEQQRLSIARCLAREPDVILLDEPFAHLDAHLKMRIGNYLKVLSNVRGTTCVLVSHEGQDVLQWCSEIHFLLDGTLKRSASPIEYYFNPTSTYEALFFGEINELTTKNGSLLFRPTEYEITSKGSGTDVSFVSSEFAGPYWRNTVCTSKGEIVVLFAQESLNHVEAIKVVKKNP